MNYYHEEKTPAAVERARRLGFRVEQELDTSCNACELGADGRAEGSDGDDTDCGDQRDHQGVFHHGGTRIVIHETLG
jgi:hypothetical protein